MTSERTTVNLTPEQQDQLRENIANGKLTASQIVYLSFAVFHAYGDAQFARVYGTQAIERISAACEVPKPTRGDVVSSRQT